MHPFGSGKIFRSGTIQDAGARFLATVPHQLFKQMVGTPHGSAGLGKKFRKRWKVCRKYFLVRGYGATPNHVRGYGASFFAEKNFASDGKFAGSIFLVRGYGARFIAEQNFASDEKFATSIFGSGATGQALSRSKISQAMKSWQKVFFGPGLRGKIFGGEKCRKR